jgi:predicted GNAT family N-acyltransferase
VTAPSGGSPVRWGILSTARIAQRTIEAARTVDGAEVVAVASRDGGRAEAYAAEHGATRLWCNARTPAVGFYERHGWTTVGEEFDVPPIGPHYRMVRSTSGST